MWPRSVKTSRPVAVSQSLIVRSKLAVASRRPSGLNAAQMTSAVWPIRVWSTRPLVASRMTTELTSYSRLRDASPKPLLRLSWATSFPSALFVVPSRIDAPIEMPATNGDEGALKSTPFSEGSSSPVSGSQPIATSCLRRLSQRARRSAGRRAGTPGFRPSRSARRRRPGGWCAGSRP